MSTLNGVVYILVRPGHDHSGRRRGSNRFTTHTRRASLAAPTHAPVRIRPGSRVTLYGARARRAGVRRGARAPSPRPETTRGRRAGAGDTRRQAPRSPWERAPQPASEPRVSPRRTSAEGARRSAAPRGTCDTSPRRAQRDRDRPSTVRAAAARPPRASFRAADVCASSPGARCRIPRWGRLAGRGDPPSTLRTAMTSCSGANRPARSPAERVARTRASPCISRRSSVPVPSRVRVHPIGPPDQDRPQRPRTAPSVIIDLNCSIEPGGPTSPVDARDGAALERGGRGTRAGCGNVRSLYALAVPLS